MAIYITYPLKPSAIAIILNGEREAIHHFRDKYSNYELIIICDGAWYDAKKMIDDILKSHQEFDNSEIFIRPSPKLIPLGDGDSILEQKNSTIPDHFLYIADQDTTDFEKALLWLRSHYRAIDLHIDVYWANGGDIDHTLGNLSLAAKYHDNFNLHFFTNNQYYRYLVNDVTVTHANGLTISFYPFPDLIVNRSEGLLYPMSNYHMRMNTQQSLRNKINSDMVSIDGQGSYFVFLELKNQ